MGFVGNIAINMYSKIDVTMTIWLAQRTKVDVSRIFLYDIINVVIPSFSTASGKNFFQID